MRTESTNKRTQTPKRAEVHCSKTCQQATDQLLEEEIQARLPAGSVAAGSGRGRRARAAGAAGGRRSGGGGGGGRRDDDYLFVGQAFVLLLP